jgi:hypothetical protein
MDCHLVTIKVGIESGADQGVNLDGAPVNKYRFESLDTETVQGRCPVKPDWSFLGNFLQYVIYLRFGSFN